jgi:hypothetical protein
MKKALFPILLLFGAFLSPAQSPGFVWAKQLAGTGDDVSVDIALDAAGNAYTAGYFDKTLDCDPGPGTFTLSSDSAKGAYISKLDPQGNFLWAKQISGPPQSPSNVSAYVMGMAVSPAGEVYITGSFSGAVDFDPGPGQAMMNGGPVGSNIFICKLDALGNFVWAKQMGNPTIGTDSGHSIALDTQNNLYITGYFMGVCDFDPGIGSYTMTTTNAPVEAFVSKFDAAGNFAWARQLQTSSGSMGNDVIVEGSGNIYSTGSFINSGDFDPGPGTYSLTAVGSQESYLWKLDASGNFVWARCVGGPSVDGGTAVATDAAGNAYMSGFFTGTVDLDPGAGTYTVASASNLYDLFILKFDPMGNLTWGRSGGGPGEDVAAALCLGANGDLYVTGHFDGTVDFNFGAGTYTLSAVSKDAFICSMDAAGGFKWVKQLVGTNYSGGSGITIDAANSVYSTGIFALTVDFNTDPGSLNLTALADGDIYVHKMSCGSAANLTLTSNASMLCAGNTATLTANGAASYSWNAVAGSSLLVVSPTLSTTYTINAIDANGCSSSASIIQNVSACTSLENVGGNSAFLRIYPNPAKNILVIETGSVEKMDLEIRNALGQLIIYKHLINSGQSLNLEQLPAGIYFVNLLQDHTVIATQKLVEEHQ